MERSREAQVAECLIPECVYNRASRCHARAITVAGGHVAECRTFYSANTHAPRREITAVVGACTAYACRHNAGFLCEAGQIYVGYAGPAIGCLTYSP